MAEKTFGDLLQDFVNKSYEELLSLANDALTIVVEALSEISPDGNASDFILPFIATTFAVDGQFTQLEYKFLNDLLNSDLSYEDSKACVEAYYNTEIFDLVDQMIDACGEDLKSALVIFCLCFASVDETITREESAYIAKLLS